MAIYTVRGSITLTSATHQTAAERSKNHSPLISTNVMTDAGSIKVPIVTANSVRAVLRRLAGERIMESLRSRSLQIPRDLFLSIVRGSYSRTGIKPGGATIRETVASRRHVFAGLFGGGACMFPSRLSMDGDLMPMVGETRELFPSRFQSDCRDSAIRRGPDGEHWGSSLTMVMLLTSRDDFADGKGFDVVEDVEEAYRQYMTVKTDSSAAKKAQKKAQQEDKTLVIADEDRAKATDLRGFNTLDVIVPGTRLYFGLRLDNPTPAQLGLTLLALQDWANLNALGGGSARGRGRFIPSLTLTCDGEILSEALFGGDVPFCKLACVLPITEAVAAAEAEIAAQTREVLMEVYPISTEPDAIAA